MRRDERLAVIEKGLRGHGDPTYGIRSSTESILLSLKDPFHGPSPPFRHDDPFLEKTEKQ